MTTIFQIFSVLLIVLNYFFPQLYKTVFSETRRLNITVLTNNRLPSINLWKPFKLSLHGSFGFDSDRFAELKVSSFQFCHSCRQTSPLKKNQLFIWVPQSWVYMDFSFALFYYVASKHIMQRHSSKQISFQNLLQSLKSSISFNYIRAFVPLKYGVSLHPHCNR